MGLLKKHRLFAAWNAEKEEQWLNKMSREGWQLRKVSFGTYTFEEGGASEYSYRIELLNNLVSHPESTHYLAFLEEAGIEYVDSYIRWVYLKKKTDDAGFELFSDTASRVKQLNVILLLLGVLGVANLLNGANQLWIWSQARFEGGIYLAIICLALGLLCAYGFIRLLIKKRRLKKARRLFE